MSWTIAFMLSRRHRPSVISLHIGARLRGLSYSSLEQHDARNDLIDPEPSSRVRSSQTKRVCCRASQQRPGTSETTPTTSRVKCRLQPDSSCALLPTSVLRALRIRAARHRRPFGQRSLFPRDQYSRVACKLRVRSPRDMRWSPNSRSFAGLPGGLAWSGLRPATYSDHRVCVRPELGRTASAAARLPQSTVALPPTLPPEQAARAAKTEESPRCGSFLLGPARIRTLLLIELFSCPRVHRWGHAVRVFRRV